MSQNQDLILESIKQNRNRILFFLSFVVYCFLAVLGTTDKDLFLETAIKFPLLNIDLPLLAFYVVMPIFIILFHFNALYLYKKHNLRLAREKVDDGFPLGVFDNVINKNNSMPRWLISGFVGFVFYVLPTIVLYTFWWRFNDYQNIYISFFHVIVILLNFLLVLKLNNFKKFKWRLIVGFLITLIIQILISSDNFAKSIYPKLSLKGETLFTFDTEQLEVLRKLDNNKKQLALYQSPLNLSGRYFKYANFSNTVLVNANLENANLQGAYLRGANLQGIDLENANLQDADLSNVTLKGANLRNANLQGADLSGVKLKVRDLQDTKIKDANLIGSEIQF
jgi:hypothetical protein